MMQSSNIHEHNLYGMMQSIQGMLQSNASLVETLQVNLKQEEEEQEDHETVKTKMPPPPEGA